MLHFYASAFADDFDVPIQSFPDRMASSFRKIKERTEITLVKCLDGDDKTRTVCTYKLDDYMFAMAAGDPGEKQLSDLTLVCTPSAPVDAARCIIAYATSMAAFMPDIDRDDRGKIIRFLFEGLKTGDAAQLTKDGHRIILQKVGGQIWFHLEANSEG